VLPSVAGKIEGSLDVLLLLVGAVAMTVNVLIIDKLLNSGTLLGFRVKHSIDEVSEFIRD
jgi:Na+-transporting NADH:ubiquinone oxidoreductase subunit NqrD